MTISNRSEIVFVYDSTFANPNGDPLDANKPRIDEETSKNIVTDVRLKRTVRDYLFDLKGEEIFIRDIMDENEHLQDAKMRAEDFLPEGVDKSKLKLKEMQETIRNNILAACIDVRLFGATIPIEKNSKEKSSVTFTGPVQFRMGQSMHRVKMQFIKGTGAFASGSDRGQKTFREEYIFPYSLVAFYGIINESAAKHTSLAEEDVRKLLDGLWNGTKNLLSRSKAGQQPRFLLRVAYKEKYFHIGELDKLVSFKSEKNDEDIRDIEDGAFDFEKLITVLTEYNHMVDYVELTLNKRLMSKQDLGKVLAESGIDVREMTY